jgi:hypothetical protein
LVPSVADNPHRLFLPLEDLLGAARAVAGEEAIATHSSSRFVELSAAGVTKAAALRGLCARLGIDATRVVACGDMPNDLPMRDWAGHGVAVANAHPDVLAAADEETLSNDEDGVACVLERETAIVIAARHGGAAAKHLGRAKETREMARHRADQCRDSAPIDGRQRE